MLSGASLCNDSLLTHSFSKKSLSENIVDLVGARVVEIFALQDQANAQLLTEIVALGDDAWTPRVFTQ